MHDFDVDYLDPLRIVQTCVFSLSPSSCAHLRFNCVRYRFTLFCAGGIFDGPIRPIHFQLLSSVSCIHFRLYQRIVGFPDRQAGGLLFVKQGLRWGDIMLSNCSQVGWATI